MRIDLRKWMFTLCLAAAGCGGGILGMGHNPDMADPGPDLIVLHDYYKDADGDGYGSGAPMRAAQRLPGWADKDGDCDDTNHAIHPGAMEMCNHADDNCNSQIDEGLRMQSFFQDLDHDGYGGRDFAIDCAPPPGYVDNGRDCNDENVNIHPGAPEQCNGGDDDCDGLDDDDVVTQDYYPDHDGDGFPLMNAQQRLNTCNPPPGYVSPRDANGDGVFDGDCDDDDPNVYPGASDLCGDGKVNDCFERQPGRDSIPDRVCFSTCGGSWAQGPYKLPNAETAVLVSRIDLDGNGSDELIVQDVSGFAILDTEGRALYEESTPQKTYNYNSTRVVAADVDDYDAYGPPVQTLEIFSTNNYRPNVYKLSGRTITRFTNSDPSVESYRFPQMMARDMDGDGTPELFTATNGTVKMRAFRFDRSKGTINQVTSISDPQGLTDYDDPNVLTDLDGDGVPDFLFGNGYPQLDAPSAWGGRIYAKKFTDLATLASADLFMSSFATQIQNFFPGSVRRLLRVGDEIRADITYFTSNQKGVANPSASKYWSFDLKGNVTSGPLNTSKAWTVTTDVDRDSVGDDWGSLVAEIGLYDVNGDTYPDRIYGLNGELRVDLWNPKRKQFEENVASRLQLAQAIASVQVVWDIDHDGRLDVITSDDRGKVSCQQLGRKTWSQPGVLPPRFPVALRTYQWDNYEPNEGADQNGDGLPDPNAIVRIPSALTASGNFHGYLSSVNDKDYYLLDTQWNGYMCLQAPAKATYKLRVFSYSDRFNNANKMAGPDGKADGLVWEGTTPAGGQVCWSGYDVVPQRNGAEHATKRTFTHAPNARADHARTGGGVWPHGGREGAIGGAA